MAPLFDHLSGGLCVGHQVVDLLITMAKTACFSPRQATIFTPYPNIVDPEETSKLALSDKVGWLCGRSGSGYSVIEPGNCFALCYRIIDCECVMCVYACDDH